MAAKESVPVSTWKIFCGVLFPLLIIFPFSLFLFHSRDEVVRVGADYLFVWDSEARITNARTLQILMQYNR